LDPDRSLATGSPTGHVIRITAPFGHSPLVTRHSPLPLCPPQPTLASSLNPRQNCPMLPIHPCRKRRTSVAKPSHSPARRSPRLRSSRDPGGEAVEDSRRSPGPRSSRDSTNRSRAVATAPALARRRRGEDGPARRSLGEGGPLATRHCFHILSAKPLGDVLAVG
jgi:hypothetical protein